MALSIVYALGRTDVAARFDVLASARTAGQRRSA
jgi:hypothetical protein